MNPPFPPPIDRVLYTEEQIEQRIREVAAEITARYRDRSLKLIGVLKGSVFFLTALARHLEIPVRVDYLAISSFSASKSSPGVVRIATTGASETFGLYEAANKEYPRQLEDSLRSRIAAS